MEAKDRIIKSFEVMVREVYGPEWSGDRVIREVAETLAKAMGTTGIAGLADATALRLENLDATMTSVLFTNEHLKLFSWLPKVPSIQPLYQWVRRLQYGSHRGSPGFREGGTPAGGVGAWRREQDAVRYMGVRGGITHQMLQTGALGGSFVDPVTEENTNRTLQLLEMIERWLVWGDSAIKDKDGNTVNYDGIIKQLQTKLPKRVIDLRGQPPSFELFEELGYTLYQEGKVANFQNVRAFMSPFILSDLSKMKLAAERKLIGTGGREEFIPGVPLAGYDTNFGRIPFEPSIFLEPVEGWRPRLVMFDGDTGDPGNPGAPTSVTATAAADATSKLDPGTYYYSAGAFNDSGESLVSSSSPAVAVAAGQKVTITVSRVNGATGYRIYRGTSSDPATHQWIAMVPQPPTGDAVYEDKGQWIPGSGVILMLERNPENIAIAQMAPLIKFPLAIVSTTIEFLLLLYHTLVVKAPEREFVVINVGRWNP